MRFVWIALFVTLLMPTVVQAASFAKQSLFLSKTPVTEGEVVLIHAVVQNGASETFDGSLIFFAQASNKEKEKIGTSAVSIAGGGANTVSVSWKPLAGSYTVSAELTAQDGTVVETQTENFTIDQKPEPKTEASSDLESSADVEAMIAKWAPSIATAAHPVLGTIDSLRAQANNLIDQGLDWSKHELGGNTDPGSVLGVATSKGVSPQGLVGTLSYIAAMVALYFFIVLKWIVSHAGVFYPVLAFAFLFALWKIFSKIRRPSY